MGSSLHRHCISCLFGIASSAREDLWRLLSTAPAMLKLSGKVATAVVCIHITSMHIPLCIPSPVGSACTLCMHANHTSGDEVHSIIADIALIGVSGRTPLGPYCCCALPQALENGGAGGSDEEDDDHQGLAGAPDPRSYVAEQDDLKKAFLSAAGEVEEDLADAEEELGGVLKRRKGSKAAAAEQGDGEGGDKEAHVNEVSQDWTENSQLHLQ